MESLELKNYEDDQTPTFCDEFKNYYGKEGEKDQIDINNVADYPEGFDDVSDEDQEDFTIHQSDALIACATAQDDFSNIEVYIFDERNQSLYVHHDIILSAYPLCIEWLPINYQTNSKANYAIVGSFMPEIEIWNLDLLDAVDPDAVLGKVDDEKFFKNMKKKKAKAKLADSPYHTDAVLSLNVNPFNK
jgi:periodic tryptophan protein 1